ncbi:hypothetical protein KCU85_g1371, partial [Aureobasidium melanogenum]
MNKEIHVRFDLVVVVKCTTMSDIARALDETHDRIASMSADELKRERVDSVNSLKAVDHPKWLKPIKAFDQKKYLGDLESGDITLRQIQVAANLIKLLEGHVANYIRVNGKLPEPRYGPGKCTSDNIEDALKKDARPRTKDEAIASLFLAVNHSRVRSRRPNILRSHSMLLNRMKENKIMTISRLNNEDKTTSIEQLRDLLKARHEDSNGTKAELMRRLAISDAKSSRKYQTLRTNRTLDENVNRTQDP